jgi:apolipoprotein N-acyltransferase
LLAVFAGAFAALALAPLFVWPAIFVSFPLLVLLLDGRVGEARGRVRRFFHTGWLFGFGYFLAGLWWVGSAFLVDAETFAWLLPVAVMALPAGMALFWGLAAALASFAWREGKHASWGQIIVLACAFAIGEFLRGTVLTGFPWNLIGYAAMPSPLAMQSASLIGAYGVSALTVFAACLPVLVLKHGGWRGVVPTLAALIAAHLGYGAYSLSIASTANEPGVRLRIVQPNLTQDEKWDRDNEDAIMARYLALTQSSDGPQPTHVIWPESAFPFILQDRPDRLQQIAESLHGNTQLVTGAMRAVWPTSTTPEQVFNALYVVSSGGALLDHGDKTRLVPFGEYLPLGFVLKGVGLRQLVEGRGFTPGLQRKVIPIDGAPPFLPLICYEIIFSGQLLSGDQVRPGWIVNLTNDGWFGQTSGPYQHFHASQIRAVEEGLPVVRAANSGISGIIDANGRVRAALGLGKVGVVDGPLPRAAPITLYSRIGTLPFLLLICICYGVSIGLLRSGKRKQTV